MKNLVVVFLIFLSIKSFAQKSLDDSLAKQGDLYINSKIPSVYNPQKAFELYTQSAQLGNARAMNAVGICYKMGYGTKKNHQLALDWFQKAGNAGYTKAWYNLGLGYKEALDFDNAYQCFSKSADLGDPQSIYAKGYMLYKGFGCTQDYSAAATSVLSNKSLNLQSVSVVHRIIVPQPRFLHKGLHLVNQTLCISMVFA